jgi:phage baseplate assembly protein W
VANPSIGDGVERSFLGVGWALPVRPADGDVALAAYDEDVREAVKIVLGTDPGERVMRPTFGAGLNALAFEPISTTTIALVRHRVETALVTWEPRIDVLAVRVSADDASSGRLDVEVDYRVRATNTFYNLVYPFYLMEGGTS